MRDLEKWYRGRPVLVTGHTGFKGSWMAAWLKGCGAKVSGYALAPEPGQPSLFDAAEIGEGMSSHIADVRDLSTFEAALQHEQPELVFHLAAQSLVRRSFREPVETYATNVMGTVNVIEAALRTPSVKAVVIVTTDKCYRNVEWVWGYREIDQLGGKDVYSSSKACAELVAQAYRDSIVPQRGELAIATARGGNVIGGGDWSEDRLVPDLVRAITAGEDVTLRNPSAVRPWQHVLELVRGYLMLCKALVEHGDSFADAWNFGPDRENEVDVGSLARALLTAWGPTETKIDVTPSAIPESHYLRLENAKARQILGWQPCLGLDDTIRMTAQWYRDHSQNKEAAKSLIARQVNEYSDILG